MNMATVLILPAYWQNLKGLSWNFLYLPIHNLSTFAKWDPLDNQDIIGGVTIDVSKVQLRYSKWKPVAAGTIRKKCEQITN